MPNDTPTPRPTRRAVAVALRRADGQTFAVKRPDEPGEELPGVWGLPAVTLLNDETPEEGVRRLGLEKLSVELTPIRQLAEGNQQRDNYILHMTLYEASPGGEPLLPPRTSETTSTLYVDTGWLPVAAFKEAADKGSLCCRLFLEIATLTPNPSPRGRGELGFDQQATLGRPRKEAGRRLRAESTKSETLLWQRLRNRGLDGFKFRRQHAIGPYFVDFYCSEKNLAVEVDGSIHKNQARADQERQSLLEQSDIRFIRLQASDVETDMRGTLEKIREALAASSPLPPGRGASWPEVSRGEGPSDSS